MEREAALPATLMIMVNVSPLTETNSRPGATVTNLPYLSKGYGSGCIVLDDRQGECNATQA
ncbi:hypothetical protein [Pseudomonas sp. MWU12-2345]|uniref:hypothetical protein n=1 Tax=Pseudomonas sp. MWU12-2345 TaxID=2928689 RepID=UPI00200E6379|nr:hypothetical protein [Pseudomonas sp. MWU12-2345]